MWIRSVLKENAKTNLRGKYWTALGVTILVGIISGAFSGIVSNILPTYDTTMFNYNFQTLDEVFSYIIVLLPKLIFGIAITTFLGYLFYIFVSSVLQVGHARWFSRNRESTATPSVGITFSLFKGGSYLRAVGSMLWMNLFLFLWSLPATIVYFAGFIYLVINGFQSFTLYAQERSYNASLVFNDKMTEYLIIFLITMLAALLLVILYWIKTYSYKMTPWILADNPQIGFRRALKLSIDLTRGYKWQIFVLDLSFIGWYILGFLACCIGTLFVAPYYLATQAELYSNLRQNGVAQKLCSMEELGFIAVAPTEELPQPPSEFGLNDD